MTDFEQVCFGFALMIFSASILFFINPDNHKR